MEPAEYRTLEAVEERHWWYLGLQELVTRLVRAEAVRAGRPLAMLDAGCGTGRLAQLLGEFGTVSACDVHPLALEGARRRGITDAFATDLSSADSGLGQDRYDVITCMDVLYHRMVNDDLAALRNLHAALRPGGVLLLQLPAFASLRGWHDERVHTRHRYQRRELAKRLVAAGFATPQVFYRLAPLFAPTLLWRRFVGPLLSSEATGSDVAKVPSGPINNLLASYVKAENRALLAGVRPPFGTSVFAIARK